MESVKDWIQVGMFVIAILGWLYSILKKVETPYQDIDKRIRKIETTSPIQHLAIEEKFRLMNEKSLAIDNHLKHIEICMNNMDKNIAIILDRELQNRKLENR